MKSIVFTVLSLLILSEVSAGPGNEFWEKKDYQQWSAKECKKLLENSPWAQKLVKNNANPIINEGDRFRSTIEYVIRLYSALPIRQALIRQSQISPKYESLTPEKKMAFDQRTESFLSSSLYSNTIVVSVEYRPIDLAAGRDADYYWANPPAKQFVLLRGGNGVTVPLMRYVPPDGSNREFQYVFPRMHEGRPVITPEDKELVLEFPTKPVYGGGGPPTINLIRFQVKKMIVGGTLDF